MKRLSLMALACASIVSLQSSAMERDNFRQPSPVLHKQKIVKHVTWSNAVRYAFVTIDTLATKVEINEDQLQNLKQQIARDIIGMHTELRVTVFYVQRSIYDFLLQNGFESAQINNALSQTTWALTTKIENRRAFYNHLQAMGIQNIPQGTQQIPGHTHPTWGKVIATDQNKLFIQFTAHTPVVAAANVAHNQHNNLNRRQRRRAAPARAAQANQRGDGAENVIRDAIAIDNICNGLTNERLLLSQLVRKESVNVALNNAIPAKVNAQNLSAFAVANGVVLHILTTQPKTKKIQCTNVQAASDALRNIQPGNTVHFACHQGNHWVLFTVIRKGTIRLVIGHSARNQSLVGSAYLTTINKLILNPRNAATILNQHGAPQQQQQFVGEEDFSSEE